MATIPLRLAISSSKRYPQQVRYELLITVQQKEWSSSEYPQLLHGTTENNTHMMDEQSPLFLHRVSVCPALSDFLLKRSAASYPAPHQRPAADLTPPSLR